MPLSTEYLCRSLRGEKKHVYKPSSVVKKRMKLLPKYDFDDEIMILDELMTKQNLFIMFPLEYSQNKDCGEQYKFKIPIYIPLSSDYNFTCFVYAVESLHPCHNVYIVVYFFKYIFLLFPILFVFLFFPFLK